MTTASEPTLWDMPQTDTLSEARTELKERLDEGTRCPCCDQHAQRYRWSLYGTAAKLLIRMYQAGGTERFVETKAIKDPGMGGDASRLRHWGLAEQESERRADGGRSGWWRVTPLGQAFVLDQATIPKYAWVYNGTCERWGGEPVTIREALGSRFRYDEIVGGMT